MNRKSRENGILFPISCLPGNYGIGTLGKHAFRFVDFLSSVGAEIWQMLPLNVTSYGDSPYQSPSNNGLNYYFIDLDTLIEKGLLKKEEVEHVNFGSSERKINYGLLFENRIAVLKKAYQRFDKTDRKFIEFVNAGKYHDFAFFMTMKSLHHFSPWYEWNEDERIYRIETERKVIAENQDLYLFYLWTQYEFLLEYKALKNYANQKGILLMGDMPLYLAYDSVEAYKHSELFCFDEKHNPTIVAGCPPDYFNEDGQLWGNPIYNWEYMKKTNYEWWNKRIEGNLELFDILRIDHFRGIAGYYTIPYGATNAREGKWITGPGMDLFEGKQHLPIIAEDLGFIDEPVKELLRKTTYPGMKVLEFAFDGREDNDHKPSQSKENYVCYTGTHDNEPLLSYLSNMDSQDLETFKKDVKKECELFHVDYHDETLKDLVRCVVSLCYASPCKLAIVPMSDVIPFGKEARLNTPSLLSDSNWSFRYLEEDFSEEVRLFLKENIQKYHR